MVSNDIIDISYSALYRDYNAGTNILVDVSNIILLGTPQILNNYFILPYKLSTGIILPKQLSAIANDKIYDNNLSKMRKYKISVILRNKI
jgi:hypothetical protein